MIIKRFVIVWLFPIDADEVSGLLYDRDDEAVSYQVTKDDGFAVVSMR